MPETKSEPPADPATAFDFLLRHWTCDAHARTEGGEEVHMSAEWSGRRVLDDRAIADEFRMTTADGTLVMLGMNIRSFDQDRNQWHMRWLDVTDHRWLELGPVDLGGVRISQNRVRFLMRFEPNEIHRITFSDISDESFTWTADLSVDGGKTWDEKILVMHATRRSA